MYRYSVDNAVTYTPDDFVLYRESPFAVWMERLTLENPDHGIPPDMYSKPPENSAERQGDIVDTLRAEGRDIALLEWDVDESERRRRTLAAMRDGADFIVDGQLALGALSGTANLLMRTSGYSELGDFLYIPCDTQDKTTLQSAFRLCFLADLLHSLQGQLPPQMLVIRGDADVVPLQTEDHIYYYRAVKQRFMDDMRNFRKHQMPDPSQSSHFGRWAECASEVLKQRASSEEDKLGLDLQLEEVEEEAAEELQLAAVAAGDTLAEQARMLEPGTVEVATPPGPTPSLLNSAPVSQASVAQTIGQPGDMPRAEQAVLRDLAFIGSNPSSRSLSSHYSADDSLEVTFSDSLGDLPAELVTGAAKQPDAPEHDDEPNSSWKPEQNQHAEPLPDIDPPEPFLLPPEDIVVAASPKEPDKPHPLDSTGTSAETAPMVDPDSAPPPSLAPLPAETEQVVVTQHSGFELEPAGARPPIDSGTDLDEVAPPQRRFSDSLITNSDSDER